MIVAGLVLIILGNVLYSHHQNVDDSGGSANVTTISGSWSVQIPAFFGGVMLVFGSIFYYVVEDEKRKADELNK